MTKSDSGHAGKESLAAMHENDLHNVDLQSLDRQAQAEGNEAVPPAELGSHSKSHVSHDLGGVHEDTKRQGNLRQGAAPSARREPPQGQGRSK